MPTYVYHCNFCDQDHEFAKPYKFSDSPENCPDCMRPLERVISIPAIKVEGGTTPPR
jgi:putative FmdB family regulatory protein